MSFRPRYITDNPRLERAPFAYLADQVCAGVLTLEEAQRRALRRRVVIRMHAVVLDRYDIAIRGAALGNLPWAIVMAELNTLIARRLRVDSGTLGNCLSTLGWLYREQGQLDQALSSYRSAFQCFTDVDASEAVQAGVRREIGAINEQQARLAEALLEYEAAERIAVYLGRTDLEAEARVRQGRVRLNQGLIEAALADVAAVLQLSAAASSDRATALGLRGVAHQLLGNMDAAQRDLQEALAICRRISRQERQAGVSTIQRRTTRDQIGRHLGSLGSLLLARGRLDEARRQLSRAIIFAERLADQAGAQQRYGNLGNLYHALAQRQHHDRTQSLLQALQYHERAVTIARARRDERSLCPLLLNIGNDYRDLGRPAEAERCYAEAAALADQHQLGNISWRIAYVRGGLADDRNDFAAAYTHYLHAIAGAEAQRGQITDVELRRHVWHDRANLYKRAALCCWRLPRPDRLRRALIHTEQAKARYLADRLEQRSKPAGGPPPDSGPRAEPGLDVLAGVWADIAAASDRLGPDGAAVVLNITDEGTLVFLIIGLADGAEARALDGWEGEHGGRLWARSFPDFTRLDLQGLLIDVDERGQVSGGYLADYYRARREGTIDHANAALLVRLASLTESLVGAVDAALVGLGVRRVVLMPNLGLALLPLHACPRPAHLGGGMLLDHYTISYTPSFRMLRHCQEQPEPAQPADRSLLLVANPTGDLIWADIEARLIRHRHAGGTITILDSGHDRRATPQAFLQAAQKHRYIHLACHGSLNLSDPLQSAISLAAELPGHEARITLEQILGNQGFPETRLVGMSACETGMIDPGSLADEYFSLPAGFLASGASTAIASLWFVNDLSTAMLMDKLYTQHLANRVDLATALREAQRWLRELTFETWAEYNEGVRMIDLISYVLLEHERRRKLDQAGDAKAHPFGRIYDWAAFTIVGA